MAKRAKGRQTEKVRMMELTRGDVRELLVGARARSEELAKLAKKLAEAGCQREADELTERVSDINERLCTQLAAELDAEELKGIDGMDPPPAAAQEPEQPPGPPKPDDPPAAA